MREVFEKTEFKIGLTLLILLIIFSAVGPHLTSYAPTDLTDNLLTPPSKDHIFGTDDLGRDVFASVSNGIRTSLIVGILAAFISNTIGVFIGAMIGYYGGTLDKVVMEIINVMLMVPTFFLIIIIASIYGSSFTNIILVIALTGWMGTARVMRGATMSLKERNFVKAAQVIGESDAYIITNHILPHGINSIIADATLSISSAILYEASLSFLGLGDITRVSLGKIIYNGKNFLISGWWISLFAGLFLILIVYAFHMIAEAINKTMMEV